MPIMFCDSLSFSGLAWTFKLLPRKHKVDTQTPAYRMLGHLPVLQRPIWSLTMIDINNHKNATRTAY